MLYVLNTNHREEVSVNGGCTRHRRDWNSHPELCYVQSAKVSVSLKIKK